MMKKAGLFLIIIGISSCIGYDASFFPNSIDESRENNLLIKTYIPSEKIVAINNTNFEILEVWSTYKFEKRYSKKINKNLILIRISLKNLSNGQIETPSDLNFNDFLITYCEGSSYNGIGVIDSMLSIVFKNIPLGKSLKNFKIGFIDNKKKEKVIVMTEHLQ